MTARNAWAPVFCFPETGLSQSKSDISISPPSESTAIRALPPTEFGEQSVSASLTLSHSFLRNRSDSVLSRVLGGEFHVGCRPIRAGREKRRFRDFVRKSVPYFQRVGRDRQDIKLRYAGAKTRDMKSRLGPFPDMRLYPETEIEHKALERVSFALVYRRFKALAAEDVLPRSRDDEIPRSDELLVIVLIPVFLAVEFKRRDRAS
jgi:hypothetical protein